MSATVAQTYVHGPAEIHLGDQGASGSLTFVGWSEAGVRITFDGAFEDVPSDISGTRIPFDVQAMAQQAFISADINIYKETVLNEAINRLNDNAAAGFLASGSVGTMLRLEDMAFRLLIYSPYRVSKSTVYSDMNHYNFWTAYLMDAVDVEVGTRYKRVRCIFRAIPWWNDNGADPYRAVLWDETITGRSTPTVLPGVP